MPVHNNFRHQRYSAARPTAEYRLLEPGVLPALGTDEHRTRMRAAGDRFRAAGVAAVYLVHGTFAGGDSLGAFAELSRVFPGAGTALAALAKQLVDRTLGDVGNYTETHVRLLSEGLQSAYGTLPVRLFDWSSQNDHIGRADAAVRLIDRLVAMGLRREQRVLIWGHSHAGNVFALATNLLGADAKARDAFFDSARAYYRWPGSTAVDRPAWTRVREVLSDVRFVDRLPRLDLATFGTPIRYGWDSGGYARLMHFVNHRPAEELPEYLAPFPPTLERVRTALDGDYVQQFGIAGTNLAPSPLAWRTWWPDRRLGRFLESGVEPATLAERVRIGARVHSEGTTLLVNYGPPHVDIHLHHAGHAVYTRPDLLLFHAEAIAAEFYGG